MRFFDIFCAVTLALKILGALACLYFTYAAAKVLLIIILYICGYTEAWAWIPR